MPRKSNKWVPHNTPKSLNKPKPFTAVPGNGLGNYNYAHYQCGYCTKDVWREGGHGVALKHSRLEHPGLDPDYKIETRHAQVMGRGKDPQPGRITVGICEKGHTYKDEDVVEGQCPGCVKDDEIMDILKGRK